MSFPLIAPAYGQSGCSVDRGEGQASMETETVGNVSGVVGFRVPPSASRYSLEPGLPAREKTRCLQDERVGDSACVTSSMIFVITLER